MKDNLKRNFTETWNFIVLLLLMSVLASLSCNAQLNFPSSITNELDGSTITRTTDAKKVVVVIHGWTNKDSAPAGYNSYNDGDSLYYLVNVLKLKLQGSDWNLVTYHWEKDASTGDIWSLSLSNFFGYTPAMIAAANASGHGSNLGSMLNGVAPNLREVHFIAHSAGSWVARKAIEYMLQANPYLVVQMTLLDPFIPDEAVGFGNTTGLSKSLMSDAAHLNGQDRIHRLENYYANDSPSSGWNIITALGPTISTQEQFEWQQDRDLNSTPRQQNLCVEGGSGSAPSV